MPVCCRKKPREGSVTLWVLTQACQGGELGRACLGKVGKHRATPWVPREEARIQGTPGDNAGIYLNHHCLGGGIGPDL